MIDVSYFTLPNGLRVAVDTDTTTAMVAVDVMYDVGARDEKRTRTGIAHLFEHLMFGGSVNIPEFDREIENAGGFNNAWTSNDFTNFYDVIPSMNIDTALHLESDRMLGLATGVPALDVQKRVVIEEFKQQCLNQPYGLLMHKLRSLVYPATHPYSWPVIGLDPAHIAEVSLNEIEQWFDSHYAPNNAVLAISGNITVDDARRKVEYWFGDLPRRDIAPRRQPAPVALTEPRTDTIYGNAPSPLVAIAAPMAAYGTHDYYVADVITDLLASGPSSRLYRLVADGRDTMFADADASITGSEHQGMIILTARLAEGVTDTHEAAHKLLAEAARLAAGGEVTQRELERSLNRFEARFEFGNINYLARAQAIATALIHNEDINDTVARQRSVTTDDIARVAGSLLVDSPATTVTYMPENIDGLQKNRKFA